MNDYRCLNCEKEVNGSPNFCSNCGQQTTIHRFSLAHFFHEGFHAFTHADKGLLYLLKELAIRPGLVAREYIGGKRKKYFNPFTFFFILAAFFMLSSNFSISRGKHIDQPVPESIAKIKDIAAKEKAMAMYGRVGKSREFMAKHGNLVSMIAVPFFALYFWLIFRRKGYNYSEHLVANLMFISLANLAFSVVVYPLQTVLMGNQIGAFVPILGFVLQWIYFVVAYKGFMQLKGLWPSFKITIATLIGLLLWIFLSLTMIAIYVYQNAHFYEYFKHMGGR